MRKRNSVLATVAGCALIAAAALPAAADTAAAPADTGPATAATSSGGAVPADRLLAALGGCDQISQGRYRTDRGAPANVPVCERGGVVHWKADLDIDCDGVPTTHCNSRTDRYFQPTTAFQQSDGRHLNAEELPFVVVPGASGVWNYRASGIRGGTVAALVYGDRVVYGVVGDTGPADIIGEASYAAARALGIDPHPTTGGAPSGVTYILFTGARAQPIESHAAAVSLGEAHAARLVAGAAATGG
ncbi:glycoside hydrolase family 75 protein [Streptomyces zhihengii]|uniref:glycoside hydrolase family 75 protein n=1 Tax=Streptomyces zhihengii TaxID=1818004 RepID=UPI0033AE8EBB